jgi:aryl-alcohol dehydrogenase-like predicted oxidoreductase
VDISRRRFLTGAAAAGLTLGLEDATAREADLTRPMPTRKLGGTGLTVSVLALGTHPLGRMKDENAAVQLVRRAYDLGITYFDTAPSYSKHRAERRVGAGLRGVRDKVLLGTKSYLLPKAEAMAELEASLKALGTDRVDLFQVHSIRNPKDRDAKLDPERGTLAAAIEARRQGKCRFIGVTGHVDPVVMASCLEVFDFDTVLVPVNCADPLRTSFIRTTLPAAKKREVAVIAMKVFAAGKLVPKAEVAECVRFALSQDVATASVGADSVARLEADVLAAKRFRPMPAAEQAALTKRFAPHPGKALEWYKKP